MLLVTGCKKGARCEFQHIMLGQGAPGHGMGQMQQGQMSMGPMQGGTQGGTQGQSQMQGQN